MRRLLKLVCIVSYVMTFSGTADASSGISIEAEAESAPNGYSAYYHLAYKSSAGTHGQWRNFGSIGMTGGHGGVSTGYGSDTSEVQIWTVLKQGAASGACTVRRSQQQNVCCVHKGGIMGDGACPGP